MLILGVDTSGKNGSIALVECGSDASRTLGIVPLEGGTFSAQLVPQVAALLQKHALNKQQIDGFAVVSGPGSFTGLRVGLAAIKALAEILKRPIVPVSRLEALAVLAGTNGRITAVLDAGRGEVYVGTYDVVNGRADCVSEQVLPAAELTSEVSIGSLVTPDPKLADMLAQKGIDAHSTMAPRSDQIARIGFRKLQDGQSVSPEALDATYIRRSEAEIKLAERTP